MPKFVTENDNLCHSDNKWRYLLEIVTNLSLLSDIDILCHIEVTEFVSRSPSTLVGIIENVVCFLHVIPFHSFVSHVVHSRPPRCPDHYVAERTHSIGVSER